MSNEITIQDVFHQFLPAYSETHLFSSEQHMTALCISKCKTAEMGANISECESCHKKYIHYNSCKRTDTVWCVRIWKSMNGLYIPKKPLMELIRWLNIGADTQIARLLVWHLSCRSKKEKMDLCRKLLNSTRYLSWLRNKTVAEKLLILYRKDICKCEACGGKLSSFRLRGSYLLTE